jgi:hypothetical protein
MANKFHQNAPKPGLVRRMQEFAEVEDLARTGNAQARALYERRKSALDRQRNVAEGKPALATRKPR